MAKEAKQGKTTETRRVRKTEVSSGTDVGPAGTDDMIAESGDPFAPPQTGDAASGDDEAVRSRAYRIWENEGRPDGGHERHWHAAREEIKRERDDGSNRG